MTSSQKLFDSQDALSQSHEAQRSYKPFQSGSAQHASRDSRELENGTDGRQRQFYHKYLSKPPLFTPDSTQAENESSQPQAWKVTQLADLMTKNFDELIKRTVSIEEKLKVDIRDMKENVTYVTVKLEENKRLLEGVQKLVESQTLLCTQLASSSKLVTEGITQISRQLESLKELVSKGHQQDVRTTDGTTCHRQAPQVSNAIVLRKQPNKLMTVTRSNPATKRKSTGGSKFPEPRRPAMMFERITSTQRYVMGSPTEQHSTWPQPSSAESSPAFSVSEMFLGEWDPKNDEE